MRIGIDARLLDSHHRYRGIGVYLESLLKCLAGIDEQNEYVLFTAGKPLPFELPAKFRHQVVKVEPLPSNLKQRLKATNQPLPWSSEDYGLDLFFQPDIANGLPRDKAKCVAVVYDLIPVLFKSRYFPRLKPGKTWLVQRALLAAYKKQLRSYKKLDKIIAISDSTKADLLKFDTQLPAYNVEVIHLGVEVHKRFQSAKQHANKAYFLYVGSCDFRKNVVDLVLAFNLLRSQGIKAELILVGRDFLDAMPVELQKEIEQSPYRPDIKLPGFVGPQKLAGLYRDAAAFLFASLYEGFGMPPLEAMAHGCPVISYRNSSLPEALDGAALWANSPEQMAAGMTELLDRPDRRQQLAKRGKTQAAKFSWQTTAEKTLKLFERLSHG